MVVPCRLGRPVCSIPTLFLKVESRHEHIVESIISKYPCEYQDWDEVKDIVDHGSFVDPDYVVDSRSELGRGHRFSSMADVHG